MGELIDLSFSSGSSVLVRAGSGCTRTFMPDPLANGVLPVRTVVMCNVDGHACLFRPLTGICRIAVPSLQRRMPRMILARVS